MLLLINEVHPNQNSGSEWIELACEEESLDLSVYAIFDETRKIYQLSSEKCADGLLVIEVSGLNNDQDAVTIKDNNGEIIDSFGYQSTEKGLSWSRQTDGSFVIDDPSRGESNPVINIPEPSLSPTPTTSATTTPSLNVSVTKNYPSATATPAEISVAPTIYSQTEASLAVVQTAFKLPYNADVINLQIAPTNNQRDSRLVILGQRPIDHQQIVGVIMASCLMLLSAVYLLYVKRKSSRC